MFQIDADATPPIGRRDGGNGQPVTMADAACGSFRPHRLACVAGCDLHSVRVSDQALLIQRVARGESAEKVIGLALANAANDRRRAGDCAPRERIR
ncbi:hypothetical protein Xant_05635 [Xanthomonas cissicola]|uniref:Uncharacterized protein n=1 Tax=Xanthomonas cissicola TaxID=86186 RepID=A0ABX3M3P1_9XANT|nr:hypothetical protein Xant_05635 [Xanthomonas cissicola]